MAPRRSRYRLIDLVLFVALCALVAAFVRWIGLLPTLVGKGAQAGTGYFATFVALEVSIIAWFIIWKSIRAKRVGPECRECGHRFVPPKKTSGPAICPRCRQRSLSPVIWQKEQPKIVRVVVVFVLILAMFLGLLLSESVGAQFDRGFWVALPLISLGASLGLIALLVLAVFIVVRVRTGLMRRENFALAHARKAAGCEGEVVRSGPATIWYSGPPDPAPMLTEQFEIARRRSVALLGEVAEDRPLRILCFHKRDALVVYHRQALANLWNLDGLYAPAPLRTITLSTEVVPYRLADPERTARSLFGLYLLDACNCHFPRPWLQQGVANLLTTGGDDEELGRLNRKMLASLGKETALGAELFRFGPTAMLRLVRGWYDHETFRRFAQFNAQSWSLIEYLGGAGAPEGRRDRFRAFLKEIRPRMSEEAAFERHFGHGFERLLEDWKTWVLDRGVGAHAPAPDRARKALTGRVVPIIRDRGAKLMDRIQAIRDMGRSGYVVGVDALIGLLREPGDVSKEELIWSLEAISGLTLGDDPEGWLSWYSVLPAEITVQPAQPTPNPGP